MSHWTRNYVGLPYCPGGRDRGGIDCWGLVRLFYQEELDIPLPELPGISAEGALAISREILAHSQQSWMRLSNPTEGCVVAMSQKLVLHHVGIWTQADGGRVIHCWNGPVIADTLDSLRRWKGVRTIEFYGLHR